MKKVVIGILANVDAGKTSLAEAMLYQSGAIRHLGRVDKQDAFLDPDQLERQRGITIFSHQANLEYQTTQLTLLDTPGHIDFASQTEAVLSVLDYAILVVSATSGVQSYTRKIWQLLHHYQVPTFIFVNKMDVANQEISCLMSQLQENLSTKCISFADKTNLSAEAYEELALQDEQLLSEYLAKGKLATATIQVLIQQRKVFPCFFGSALKLTGISKFLTGLNDWTAEYHSEETEFSARVFKISHNQKGERLTWLRVFAGKLQPRQPLGSEQKVSELRVYQGDKYQGVDRITAGAVCTIPGLKNTYVGQGLGKLSDSVQPELKPVLTYEVATGEYDPLICLEALRELADEDQQLHVLWNQHQQKLSIRIMGKVQLEILQQLLADRYDLKLKFVEGKVLYQETITQLVEGVGHFEPLRHYAEVHLLLEPGPLGSGLTFANNCPNDMLATNWQKQIMSDLTNKEHLGVLLGAPLTDVKLTLISGKYSNKHTVGGDFRQATWRAVRQGLMVLKKQGQCQLLEPWYQFSLTVNQEQVGRALNDLQLMNATFQLPKINGQQATQTIKGKAPVVKMQNYAQTLRSYTHGQGQLECSFAGYQPCQAAAIIAQSNYQPTSDLDNTPDSVFCAKGAAVQVPWDEVADWMHLPYSAR
ncbi:TetM/TetW/TetO/TetS family tetracycline resistance ribosomal protection protein [Lactobacillus sp. ESL0681]|uniref:elongation factor G n=1 Tax=Lactobacillus sp. ESL0681 TaxID=2983211 RepID=UPI0023F76268|nr:TetM/TetW/TetO/TetS family tetracycline resistance ribosomal protection protein [Lactobacillus sp. ESL0681]WEV41081.1 TetM/TetW/TetO/TetS family tetracycline resistance ribosomal protection protein [Lactobacillus sp. ESL0681]